MNINIRLRYIPKWIGRFIPLLKVGTYLFINKVFSKCNNPVTHVGAHRWTGMTLNDFFFPVKLVRNM